MGARAVFQKLLSGLPSPSVDIEHLSVDVSTDEVDAAVCGQVYISARGCKDSTTKVSWIFTEIVAVS